MSKASSLRVLVAEDEPSMLALVASHMRTLGANVVEASDGEQALALAKRHKPDLILLDVMMPGMSGWELCKRIKGDETFNRTGVIMLTGIGETMNEMTSPLFAADAWLNKPFEFAELDATVRRTLGEYDKSLPSPNGSRTKSPARERRDTGAKAAPTKKAAPKKAAAKKAAPKKAAKKTAPKKAAAKKAAPKAASRKAPAKKAAKPKKAAPGRKPSKKSAPKKKR